ncbi:MAG: zinc ABC transporter substrate-binding protein, partial [Verrucomicrobia bacterium]|nr:zinc ABC transporter substrate-binding protein [Verrucomicrobiota bacterium]
KEFGFNVIAVAGLNKEQESTPQDLARTIESVKKSGVPAIFPEEGASRRTVDSIARATGTKVASPLISDGNGTRNSAGFEGMIRNNVNAITRGFGVN